MSGRFLSKVDMAEAKFALEMFELAVKRGEILEPEDISRLYHVVCGCGQEGCIFIRASRNEENRKKS